ncbi:MAG: CsbD family protein [Phenylobacterium sp.]|uniref:CsbD family protein n=1 Tax=Phenylobacterium sp. TaxID=1871053 RepID=UPI0027334172|nr:CsbD family protein [Phenylobacterium sp.]MDP3174574.1 CsbD family protein [Phenylobacterium sp.]
MHKDTAKGAAKDAAGSVKEAVGRATGNERLEAEGAGEKVAGKVQKGVGNLKDAARDVLKK